MTTAQLFYFSSSLMPHRTTTTRRTTPLREWLLAPAVNPTPQKFPSIGGVARSAGLVSKRTDEFPSIGGVARSAGVVLNGEPETQGAAA